MQFLRFIIGLFIISCLIHTAQGRGRHVSDFTIYGTQNLVAEINRIVQNTDPRANIGIEIKSMKYGDTLYAKNDQHLLAPASILKIFTAEAALLYLGSNYTFPTGFFTDSATTQQGVLNGNIYLVHSGDPSLTYNDLTDLMVNLKAQQIHGIVGNVYIDNTAYDQVGVGPGWGSDDARYCYGAPINASIINHNCLSLKISPAKQLGHIANIVPNGHYYYGAIQNEVTTKSAHARSCYLRLHNEQNHPISISGCMPKGHHAQGVSTVIGNILQYNKSLLNSLFKRFGIHVKGTIDAGSAPPNASALAVHESKPLHTLVKEMLKLSDNIIAGSLFKKMGAVYTQRPGSWQNGSIAVKQILAQRIGMDTSQMNILDGSGLSPDNRIKPSQMMQVLDFAYHHGTTNYPFIYALPIAGIDGTLKHRLHNVTWKVRAKTGTIAGVASLAGYTISKTKEPLAFVIIINGHNGNIWKYREMEDKIVTALAHYQRET